MSTSSTLKIVATASKLFSDICDIPVLSPLKTLGSILVTLCVHIEADKENKEVTIMLAEPVNHAVRDLVNRARDSDGKMPENYLDDVKNLEDVLLKIITALRKSREREALEADVSELKCLSSDLDNAIRIFMRFTAIIRPSTRRFLELPHELIISVLSILEVLDILRARRVCHQLHDATRQSHLWLQVLQRRIPEDALGVIRITYGTHFESLALKLARRLIGRGAVQLRAVKTHIKVDTCHFIPGARWLLTVSRDRSVHAWDSLAEDVKPILLRPPHPDESVSGTFSALDHIEGGNFTLVIGKWNGSQYQINILQVTIKEDKPLLSEVGSISCPQGRGRVFVSGNCISRFLDRRPVGYAECFRWDQFLSGQPFGYAALNISLPTHFAQPTKFLPGGRLIYSSQEAIMVFKFPELQIVDQLGEKYPQMAAVPVWWFSPISLSWVEPAMKWPEPVQLSLSSFPTFLGSFSLIGGRDHVFRLSVQDDAFKVDQLVFPSRSFMELGPDLGFDVDPFYMTFLQVVDGQVVSGERLHPTSFFHTPYKYAFDEIFGNVCFVKSPSSNRRLGQTTSSDKTLEFFVCL